MRFIHNTIVQGAITGFLAAAVVDFNAFRSWKNIEEAVHYEWSIAIWRWFQGAVSGAVASAGWSAVN